eukprot:CAMPEP_0197854196 /NCGR_PEP_ID=MMETSP1438-20131217/24205_1 /TAXON_ID=1461541 /ORGANISM="Pterosperma sp., Strain CCMP1384" /LENGTH=433 /DNA_ID=CAMNT_0043468849 /DNA_START=98 /DNA_END=1399 /DNA_ORIENTATION=+
MIKMNALVTFVSLLIFVVLAHGADETCSAGGQGCNQETSEAWGVAGFDSLDALLKARLSPEELKEARRIMYGFNAGDAVREGNITAASRSLAHEKEFDLQAYKFLAAPEQMRAPRNVKVGLIQHGIVLPTTDGFPEQKQAIFDRVKELIDAAGAEGVNIICLQEAWTMPFAFATREKQWCEFAESAEKGESTVFLQELARKWNMVIVSPMLERDENHGDTIWNTAVVIGNNGNVIGKHRKNHIPRVGDFNEATYYTEGNTGHPVFQTVYGKIAINICYGRHHPLNWQAFGLNGAEIVFNPSATVGALSEPMWAVEARNAAITSNYFVGAINRVGTEVFPNAFTSGDGKPAHKDFGHFYGSSYFAGPDASRTPALSRGRDGLIIAEMDLNLVQQVKDRWMLRITARYELYAALFNEYIKEDYTPQVITDPSLEG